MRLVGVGVGVGSPQGSEADWDWDWINPNLSVPGTRVSQPMLIGMVVANV